MWQPPISEKQAAIVNDPNRFVLVSGARSSSKSYGVLHSVPWRMWSIRDYVGCLVGSTTSQSIDSGLWSILTEKVMPDWVLGRKYDKYGPGANLLPEEEWEPFGIEWVTPPRSQTITHKMFFETTNKFGGKSRFYLDSLDVEGEVERKFKGRVFCDVILSEASNFLHQSTFDCLKLCLRDFPAEALRFVLDTNPALHNPESHWIYKLFYIFKSLDLSQPSEDVLRALNIADLPEEMKETALLSNQELQNNLSVHEFSVEDNDFIADEEKRALFAAFCHSKASLDRNFWGRWVESSGDGIFGEVWRPEIHLIGEPKITTEDDPEILIPEENCMELISGSDIGRRNTGIVIIEPVQMEVEERTPQGPVMTVKTGFKVLSEFVSLGRQQSIPDIAEFFMDEIELWEGYCKRPPRFRHYSDNSAFSPDLISQSDEATEVYRLTRGLVELESITHRHQGIKGHGAVEKRIALVQRLLFENRLFVSRNKCPMLAHMFATLKRNSQGKLSTINPGKHIFDALSYALWIRCWFEMMKVPRMQTNKEAASGIVVTSL